MLFVLQLILRMFCSGMCKVDGCNVLCSMFIFLWMVLYLGLWSCIVGMCQNDCGMFRMCLFMYDRIRLVEMGVIWYKCVLWNLCLILYFVVKLKLLWYCRYVLVVFYEVFVVSSLVILVLVLQGLCVLNRFVVLKCIRFVVLMLMNVLVIGNCMFWFWLIGWLNMICLLMYLVILLIN